MQKGTIRKLFEQMGYNCLLILQRGYLPVFYVAVIKVMPAGTLSNIDTPSTILSGLVIVPLMVTVEVDPTGRRMTPEVELVTERVALKVLLLDSVQFAAKVAPFA